MLALGDEMNPVLEVHPGGAGLRRAVVRDPDGAGAQAPGPGPEAAGRAGLAAQRAAGGRVIAMTDVVSRERATAAWLSGVAGLVLLAAALVMMACAAPSLAHPRPHGATARPASGPASSPTTGGGQASRTGRAGQGRPAG